MDVVGAQHGWLKWPMGGFGMVKETQAGPMALGGGYPASGIFGPTTLVDVIEAAEYLGDLHLVENPPEWLCDVDEHDVANIGCTLGQVTVKRLVYLVALVETTHHVEHVLI